MKIRLYSSLGLLAMLSLCGCGGSSDVEMRAAEDAMNRAQSAHAELLAPTEFQEAQKTWEHAQAAAKEDKISSAKVLFASAKIYFTKAAASAKNNREALTRQLDSLEMAINSNFDQVKSDLSKTKLSAKDHEQVKAIAAEIVKDQAMISKLESEHDLIRAVAAAKEVQTKIYNAQLILAGQKPHK